MKKTGWTDLHTHSLMSDGVLLASELISRARTAGYSCIGLTDHADASNLEKVIAAAYEASRSQDGLDGIRVIPGVELTYVPPAQIGAMARRARELGAVLVVVHGETLAEQVPPGTNAAALDADIDILAHPGLLTPAQARKAARRAIALEITTRQGHCLGNGHVARVGTAAAATLVLDTDTHLPDDLLHPRRVRNTLLGSGLTEKQSGQVLQNSDRLGKRLIKRMRGLGL